jgi:serine/threonine protein kinase
MYFFPAKYIVTSTLGQGTFGKVKLATHQETGLEYAIKILDKSDIKANELTVNVRREIAIMKALSHQNIVNLREVLSSKSKLYIVMDLVRGGELFEMIERRGELDEKLARKYFQQLVDGIDYCHRRGVCHRDLKPENLLVDESGCLKVRIRREASL